MKNIIYCIFIGGILFCSCNISDVLDDSTSFQNQSFSKRVKFSSAEDFFNTGITLDTMNTQGIKNWIQKQDFNSLFNVEEESMVSKELKDTKFLRVILNENSEFQIKDSIMWYHQGKFYGVSCEKEKDLLEIKRNPTKYKEIGSIEVSREKRPLTKTQMSIMPNIAGSYQKEFWSKYYLGQPHVTHFKYVNELVVTTGHINGVFTTFLSLDIKLEWRGRKSWKEASEIRIINVDLECNCGVLGAPGALPFKVVTSQIEHSGNLRLLLIRWTGTWDGVYIKPFWVIDIEGFIFQGIKGDDPMNGYGINGQLW